MPGAIASVSVVMSQLRSYGNAAKLQASHTMLLVCAPVGSATSPRIATSPDATIACSTCTVTAIAQDSVVPPKYAVAMCVPSLAVPATCTLICTSFEVSAPSVSGYVPGALSVISSGASKLGSYTVMLAFPVFSSSSTTVVSCTHAPPYRASSVTLHAAPVTIRSACAVCISTKNIASINIIFLIVLPHFRNCI